MNFISAVDMFKIGVGPSSSHTLGPWRAALKFLDLIIEVKNLNIKNKENNLNNLNDYIVEVYLYGSLAQTGKGHGTDIAIICGLLGLDYINCDTHDLVKRAKIHYKNEVFSEHFKQLKITMHPDLALPEHANGMKFILKNNIIDEIILEKIFYSIGGGFITEAGQNQTFETHALPYPITDAQDLLNYAEQGIDIITVIKSNEEYLHGANIYQHLNNIWQTMQECIYQGCHHEGILMGGLGVHRRAAKIYQALCSDLDLDLNSDLDLNINSGLNSGLNNYLENIKTIFKHGQNFNQMIKLISTFALAVNEQNAAFSRVVTAPTNGSAGVIPAVLMYAIYGLNLSEERIHQFLLIASTIGGLFKQKATISAAMGGCQAEIGVSSSMAAAGLTHILGGSCAQVLMAAEIAMEHHLGLTCDPVGGLVQIPCIERNAMGAIKAITAANLAYASSPENAKVSLDAVIQTMWETAQDMHQKYKETATGGLAINIPVSLSEC